VKLVRLSQTLSSLILTCLLLVACGGEDTKQTNGTTASEQGSTATKAETKTNADNSSDVKTTEQESEQQDIEQEAFNWDKVSGWHTQGIVSKNSPIQINFNRDVIDESLVGKDASKVMFISPDITGTPVFESRSKIVWQPEQALAPGTTSIFIQYYSP